MVNDMIISRIVVDGDYGKLGMNVYLQDRGLSSSYHAAWCNYNYNTIQSIINKNFPVSIGVPGGMANGTWGIENHQVVVYGYVVGYDGVPFNYVNDTFGNNVSINADASLYKYTYGDPIDMWYIN